LLLWILRDDFNLIRHFTYTTQKVAETGFSLAKSLGAEVYLMHVITDPIFYTSKEFSPIMGFSGYLETDPEQLDGIDGLKKHHNIFLISSKWLENIVLGSVTEEVLQHSQIPLFIVPTKKKSSKWQTHGTRLANLERCTLPVCGKMCGSKTNPLF
jgi:hypothetical protein